SARDEARAAARTRVVPDIRTASELPRYVERAASTKLISGEEVAAGRPASGVGVRPGAVHGPARGASATSTAGRGSGATEASGRRSDPSPRRPCADAATPAATKTAWPLWTHGIELGERDHCGLDVDRRHAAGVRRWGRQRIEHLRRPDL